MPTYPGGKNGAGVYQKLINLMPPHQTYIEPFLGGAAVMRLKRPARFMNIGLDLDEDPVRQCITDLVGSPCPASGVGHGKYGITGNYWEYIVRSGERRGMAAGPIAGSGEARAARASANVAVSAELDGSGDGGSIYWLGVGDGIQFLKSYKFTGQDLVYIDPPYLMSTRRGGRLYKHEMSVVDHRRLLRVAIALPCLVMVSGYWSEMYGRTLGNWNHTSFQSMTRGGRPATEHVWFNYPTPTTLHDYRFLGVNFRERERIKRKQLRWAARLSKMDAIEKHALLAAIAETATSGDAGSAPPPSEFEPGWRMWS